MKRLLAACAMLALLLAGRSDAGAAADTPAALDPVAVGDAIHAAAVAHFGHWDAARRASFDRAWTAYRAQSPRLAGDRDAVDLAAMRLVASLRNGHSGFFDNAFFETRPWRAPFTLQYTADGRWIVTRSSVSAVRVGAVLAKVDGADPETVFRANENLVFASDEREARASVLQAIVRGTPAHGTAHLTFDDGSTFAVDNAISSAIAGHRTITARWLDAGNVAYVAIPSFDDPKFEASAVETIRRAWSASALVIDVRGNNGGSTPSALLTLLADRILPWWRESSTAPEPARELANGQHWDANRQAYRGRVVILADEECVSACEDFVMPLVVSHRARFVGTSTAGSTGQPFGAQIAEGVAFRVGSVHESFPDGSPFEGVGIAPTDSVPLRTADVRAHRDAQLARALAIARGAR